MRLLQDLGGKMKVQNNYLSQITKNFWPCKIQLVWSQRRAWCSIWLMTIIKHLSYMESKTRDGLIIMSLFCLRNQWRELKENSNCSQFQQITHTSIIFSCDAQWICSICKARWLNSAPAWTLVWGSILFILFLLMHILPRTSRNPISL